MVRYLAGEAGIRQFLDIGTGLPTIDNTHEVVQAVAPESRVVYVTTTRSCWCMPGPCFKAVRRASPKYVEADLRDPDKILQGAAETLDFNEPVAITLLMILMLIEDEDAYAGRRPAHGCRALR